MAAGYGSEWIQKAALDYYRVNMIARTTGKGPLHRGSILPKVAPVIGLLHPEPGHPGFGVEEVTRMYRDRSSLFNDVMRQRKTTESTIIKYM